METFLLVQPRFIFFIWFMKQIIIWRNQKKKKAFCRVIYIMNKDEERRCANLFPCKQLHNVCLGAWMMVVEREGRRKTTDSCLQ